MSDPDPKHAATPPASDLERDLRDLFLAEAHERLSEIQKILRELRLPGGDSTGTRRRLFRHLLSLQSAAFLANQHALAHLATLLLTCLIFLIVGWTGGTYYVTALSVGAVVCIAASNGGTTSQDLKTGFLVGGGVKRGFSFGETDDFGYNIVKNNNGTIVFEKRIHFTD